MGTVYKAYDPLLTRTVAVKVISGQLDSQPEQRERFFREARAAAQLSHRNIITIHDLGEQDGIPFLAMEYLVGRDLDARMHAPEAMSLARKIEIGLSICEGLAHAHAFGVVHRDIKPANVFLTSDGVVKILDFGLARLVTSELTRSNMMLGTLNYMAPEQLRAEPTDHRADIFSLGVVLYELLSGKKPFQGDSFASTMYKILQETPEPLDRIDPSLPPQLNAVVDRALAKAREDRYQHVLDLLRDLEAAYEPLRGSDRRIIEHVEAVLEANSAGSIPPPAKTPSRPYEAGPNAVTIANHVATKPDPSPPPATPHPISTLATPGPAAPATGSRVPRGVLYGAVAAIVLVLAAVLFLRGGAPPSQGDPTTSAAAEPLPNAAQGVPGAERPERPEAQEPVEQPERPEPRERPEPPERVEAPEAGAAAPPATARDARADENAARVGRSMRQARTFFNQKRYEEAARAVGDVLAVDRTNADARSMLQRIVGIERDQAAASRSTTEAARAAAVRANAPELVPQLFSAAQKNEAEARAAFDQQRYTAAAARFDAAASLFHTAEASAQREAETRAAREREDEERRRAEADEARRRAEAARPVPPPAPVNPEPPPAPAPREPSPEEAIGALIDRYVRALEARDMAALRAVWPGLSRAQQAAQESEFGNARAISVSVGSPRIEVSGNTATVVAQRRYALETRDGQQLRSETRTTFVMRQGAGGNWVIESVQHQPLP